MIIFNESLHTHSDEYVKYFAVDNQQTESLADFVRRVRVQVKDFSLSEVEKNSGGEIDSSYVSRIENGQVKNVTPEKLTALAKGLQISPDEIFAIARGKSLQPSDIMEEVNVLFFGWDEASEEDKAATLDAIRMIASGFQQRRQVNLKGKSVGKTTVKGDLSVKRGKGKKG